MQVIAEARPLSCLPYRMLFYLHGSNAGAYKGPNDMLGALNVKIPLQPELSDAQLAKGVAAEFEDVFEKAISHCKSWVKAIIARSW